MKLTVTYDVSGQPHLSALSTERLLMLLEHLKSGPLRTGLDAANAQLAAEDKKLRLRLVEVEVE